MFFSIRLKSVSLISHSVKNQNKYKSKSFELIFLPPMLDHMQNKTNFLNLSYR